MQFMTVQERRILASVVIQKKTNGDLAFFRDNNLSKNCHRLYCILSLFPILLSLNYL